MNRTEISRQQSIENLRKNIAQMQEHLRYAPGEDVKIRLQEARTKLDRLLGKKSR